MTLYEQLDQYAKSDYYGFHMPGHKRNTGFMKERLPYQWDITEISGFDDLHHCSGILKEAQERATSVYGAEETHFLVNGSTIGILSAIAGCTKRGDSILVARHCHKSVYHAIEMFGLKPYYVYADKREEYEQHSVLNGRIYADEVRKNLEDHPEIKAVIIVSPTYDGVVSDVSKIAKIVHQYHIPLIVDEAHGAHFGFHDYFPENSNRLGADLVIHSVHKTLPSLTQTALLHMNGKIVNRKKVRKYLHILQSSSPSYIFMASIDACIHMLETRKEEIFSCYVKRLNAIREDLSEMKRLKLCSIPQFDRSKLVFSTEGTDLSSRKLSDILLDKYHLQMEMTAQDYVLAMTSVADTLEGFQRLEHALLEIDGQIKKTSIKEQSFRMPKTERALLPWEIEEIKKDEREEKKFEESVGMVATEYAYLYPPGSPIIVPGERISEEVAEMLCRYRDCGFSIEGLNVENRIEVWING